MTEMRKESTFGGPFWGDRSIPLHLYALLFFCLSLVLTGYRVYFSNHALQLPLVHLLNDPSLYPNDPFASTLPFYASMLWRAVALLSRTFPLEPLLLVLYLIERYLVIYAAGRLARAFAPKSYIAALGAMAFFALAPKPIIGGGTIVTSYFEQTGLSIPFFLLAMAAFYRHKPFSWAFWLSLGFNLNSMYGTYALTYFGAAFVLDLEYWKAWTRWLLSLALFLALASPAIVFTLLTYRREAFDSALWVIASRVRFPPHLYPLTWSTWRLAKFGTVVTLFTVLARYYWSKMEKLSRHGIAWTVVCILWALSAFLVVYIESPALFALQPIRGTDLWHCFAGIGVIAILAAAFEEAEESPVLHTAALLAGVLILRSLASAVVALLLAFSAFCFITWALEKRPVKIDNILSSLRWNPTRLGIFLSLLVLIFGVRAFQVRMAEAPSVRGALYLRPDPQVEQIATWANTSTSLDSMFLINPTWETFRALSKRPIFVTRKDGSAMLWDRSFVTEWVERIRALGLDITQETVSGQNFKEKLNSLYLSLRDPQVLSLSERFPIRYWVVSADHPSALPVAFQNEQYKVLDLHNFIPR